LGVRALLSAHRPACFLSTRFRVPFGVSFFAFFAFAVLNSERYIITSYFASFSCSCRTIMSFFAFAVFSLVYGSSLAFAPPRLGSWEVYFLKSYVGFAEFAGAKILNALALGCEPDRLTYRGI
jgi:hypothetical protein